EVASGVAYLHGVGIVHGDIRGVNVLIDHEGRAAISDYGLSTLISSYGFVASDVESSARWQAPALGTRPHNRGGNMLKIM
ncbi:hypothetical protein PLICRDRAFT_118054, partial [Plicaturopsis crispa FD-325 SS-3]